MTLRLITLGLALLLAACGNDQADSTPAIASPEPATTTEHPVAYSQEREACDQYSDTRMPLFGDLRVRLGDNEGLSRERAGAAAEYFQQALDLPPESISYDGMGESEPVASNDTAAGRAQNRRVEIVILPNAAS